MAEQNHWQPAQGKVLRYVVARLARHDDIRTGGDGELSKVAQGAAQNGDGAARVLGIAPHAGVASEGRGGASGKVAQAAGVVECRKGSQAAGLGVVHMLQ